MGVQELSDLFEYYEDRYDPAELVEHLGITMSDLLPLLEDWLNDNPAAIQEDLEHITNLGDSNE